MITENERWLLSYYRTSEIGGALFFGRLARALRPGPMQEDMTKHFSDEAAHASYWTSCLTSLGSTPLRLHDTYQDQYVEAAGVPMNMMEVLSITQIFEKRVINQYARHLRVPGLKPEIRATLDRIMGDERWHLHWVRQALRASEATFGAEVVKETRARHARADREVFAKTVAEQGERVTFAMGSAGGPEEDMDSDDPFGDEEQGAGRAQRPGEDAERNGRNVHG
jgi:hypothetical protein